MSDSDEFPRDQKRFTVQLDNFLGRSELHHSFTNQNPKSNEDYLDPDSAGSIWEGNFIEKSVLPSGVARSVDSVIVKSVYQDQMTFASQSQLLYQIERPNEGPDDVLYFSVRGLDTTNEFEVFIHNKTFNFSSRLTNSYGLVIMGVFLNMVLILGLFF